MREPIGGRSLCENLEEAWTQPQGHEGHQVEIDFLDEYEAGEPDEGEKEVGQPPSGSYEVDGSTQLTT